MVMLQLLNYSSASEILTIISARMSNLNCIHFTFLWGSLVAQLVRNPPAVWETWVRFLGWDNPMKKGKATHSSILAKRIPWTVYSMGSQRVKHDWVTFTFTSNVNITPSWSIYAFIPLWIVISWGKRIFFFFCICTSRIWLDVWYVTCAQYICVEWI